MSKKYIKGKDGKMQGSLPSTPTFPNASIINEVPPVPVSSESIEISNKTSLEEKFAEMNRLEKEANTTLSEGLAEISKAFENIEAILKERQQRTSRELEEAKLRSEESRKNAEEAKKRFEEAKRTAEILEQRYAEAEAKKPINRIKKFLGLR
jgi:hypothetical protein